MSDIIEKTKQKIEVMQAFCDGKPIEATRTGQWTKCSSPGWQWCNFDYRIAPLVKPSIDWKQIPDQFRWLVVNNNGQAWVFQSEPQIVDFRWFPMREATSTMIRVDNVHTSFNRGTVDWHDSLVERV